MVRSVNPVSRGWFLGRPGLVSGLVVLSFALSSRLSADEVKACHILVRTREDAERIRAEVVQNGGDLDAFAKACREYSFDAQTKRQAGDLGWFPRVGKMDPVFSEAAFALQKGEVSQPVRTQYGWHLIYLRDRRDRAAAQAQNPAPRSTSGTGERASPDRLLPPDDDPHAGHDHAADAGAEARPRVETVPPPPVATGRRRDLPEKRLILSMESVEAVNFAYDANRVEPDRAVELNLVLKNGGKESRKVPAPSLLPLGFELRQHHDGEELPHDFSRMTAPESFFVALDTYAMVGREVSVNEYFKGIRAAGRFDLEWSADTFFANLEQRFPLVKDLPDYAGVKSDLSKRLAVEIDKVRRDGLPHWRLTRSRPYSFGILPRIQAGDNVYARLKISRQDEPVYIKLDTEKQLAGSNTFANLAVQGFYDMLTFHEVEDGDYIIGGSPLRRSPGAPAEELDYVTNAAGIPHEEGTVSFVSRNVRSQGPVRGGVVGSIFFVCFKKHPEWDDVHVPFGKVVSGLDILKQARKGTTIESISILPEAEYREAVGSEVASSDPDGEYRGNPQVVIKTTKGDLDVVLFEDDARRTVANFITLAEDGFYDKAEGGGHQEFFARIQDSVGRPVAIWTGSPTNDPSGGAERKIPDEVNQNRCVRGSLFMTKHLDPEAGTYVPNSASSQFFICLADIPYYDQLETFTVFGRVAPGSLAVLDKLEEGDEILGVEVTKKRKTDYESVSAGR